MDFTQAEQAFRALESSLQVGELDIESYRERLNELRVQDDQGRTWMPQERTGIWYVWNGQAWEPSEPPRPASVPVPPPPPAPVHVEPLAPSPTAGPEAAPAPEALSSSAPPDRGKNIFGIVWRLVLWAALWGAVGYGTFTAGEADTNALVGMVVLAVGSLAYLLWNLTRVYEGVIERILVEEETDTDEDGSTTTRKVTYAYVRTTDNKVKKIKAKKGFGRGDRVYKRVGDWSPRRAKA